MARCRGRILRNANMHFQVREQTVEIAGICRAAQSANMKP